MGSFTGCVNSLKIEASDRQELFKMMQQYRREGKDDKLAIQDYISKLQAEYDTLLSSIVFEDTNTSSIIPEDNTDISNSEDVRTVNLIAKWASQRKDSKGILQRVGNFFLSLENALVTGDFTSLAQKPEFDPQAVELLKSIASLGGTFNSAVQAIFKPFTEKGQVFRYKDPLQYFAQDGLLPEQIKNAIAVVNYKWLATRAKETLFNDDRHLRSILGLDENDPISDTARDLLTDVGTSQETLVNTLGSDIYKLLNLSIKKDAPGNTKERLITALGLHALATLEAEGHVQVTKIYTGRFSDSNKLKDTNTFGLGGLRNNVQDIKNKFFYKKEVGGNVTGKTSAKFYRLTPDIQKDKFGNTQPTKEIRDTIELWKASKSTWDSLFDPAEDKELKDYSWGKISLKNLKINRTKQNTTQAQKDNILATVNDGYTESTNTMNAFLLFDEQGQADLAGYVDPDTQHISRRKGISDTNRGIIRSIGKVYDWLADATSNGHTRNDTFYIPVEVDNNTRMRQVGSINPQNDKTHRYLFGIPKYNFTFKSSDPTNTNYFLMAVGLSLDIEANKVGGLEAALQATRDKLALPEIEDAIEVLRRILPELDNKDLLNEEVLNELRDKYKDEFATIIKGVRKGEKNIASFKGLLEYARYLNNDPDKDFTTDLPYEQDGMTNGPTLGFIQLATAVTPEILAMLRNAGVYTSEEQIEVAEHLQRLGQVDLYKRGGVAWNTALEAQRVRLIESFTKTKGKDTQWANQLKQQISSFTAAQRLFGEFNDKDGFVSKTMRSLTKDPVMTTGYGAGEESLIKNLTNKLIYDVIPKHLEKITKKAQEFADKNDGILSSEDEANIRHDLQMLWEDTAYAANIKKGSHSTDYLKIPAKITDSKGKFIPSSILNITIPDAIIEGLKGNIESNHGPALSEAIKTIFGGETKARNALNKGYSLATALYNVAYINLVKYYKNTAKTPLVLDEKGVKTYADLPKEIYAEIEERLRPIYPHLITPFEGGVIDIRKDSSDKNYDDSGRVAQSYTGGIETKTDYPRTKGLLPNPGVSPIVKAIQMLDATISNLTQAREIGILHVHDGFYSGIGQIIRLNESVNENMYELMRQYNLAESMYTSIKESVDAFYALQKEIDGNWDDDLYLEFMEFKLLNKDGNVNIDSIVNNVQFYSELLTENKDEIVSYIKKLNHYYFPSAGYKVADTHDTKLDPSKQKELDAVDTTDTNKLIDEASKLAESQPNTAKAIETLATDYVNKTRGKDFNKPFTSTWLPDKTSLIGSHAENVGIASTALKSSPAMDISSDPNDYDSAVNIDNQNVVDTYDQVKSYGNITDSASHDSHLKHILTDIVSKVMNPVNLYLRSGLLNEVSGKFTSDGVFVQIPPSGMLTQGIRMSTGEVLTHELVHSITHAGLKAHPWLRGHIQILYNSAKKELNKNGEGWKYFLSDPNMNVNDPLNAIEVKAAKERWNYIFEKPTVTPVTITNTVTKDDYTSYYSHHLDEFMALGLTNEHIVRALTGISTESYKGKLFKKEGWAGVVGNNIQQTLLNIFNRIMDMFMHNFSTSKPAPNVAKELERLALKLNAVDNRYKSMAMKGVEFYSKYYSKVGSYVNKQIKKQFSKLHLGDLVKHANRSISQKDNAFGQALRNYRRTLDNMDYGILQSLVTEIRGLTPRMKPFHDLLHLRGMIVDQARQEASTHVVNTLKSLWGRELTSSEKKAITKALLKTDLQVLLKHHTIEEIGDILNTNSSTLDQSITELHRQINTDPVLRVFSNYYARQAQSLGYMLTSGVAIEDNQLMNARLIASLKNTTYEHNINADGINKAEEIIDRLSTLYAIKFTPEEYRNSVYSLIQENSAAIETVMQMHTTNQLDAEELLFNNNPNLIIKGYTKEIINPVIQIVTGSLNQEQELLSKGYIRSPIMLPIDNDDPGQPSYIYISHNGEPNNYSHGIASLSGNRAKGTNPSHRAMTEGLSPAIGRTEANRIKKVKARKIQDMFDNPMVPFDMSIDYPIQMIPKVNAEGKIIDYRYMMSEHTKDTYLEKHNDYDAIMGAMAGQIKDKTGTERINFDLIAALKKLYTEEFKARPGYYVEISPFALDERHRAIYHMLPGKAKQDINSIWGQDAMFIPKDMVDLAFGQRKYSLVQAFDKDPDIRNFAEKAIIHMAQYLFKDKSITRLKQVEDLFKELAKIGRNNIVVKSFTVTAGNYFSNLLFCKAKGVASQDILKGKMEAMNYVVKYQAHTKKLREAELLLEATLRKKPNATVTKRMLDNQITAYQATIREMRNELANNKVSFLMDSGMMQSIVDDVETDIVQNPYDTEWEKQVNKVTSKLPPKLVKYGKMAFLTQDTAAYKTLNNMVKMTDFVGRYIMYNYYTDAARGAKKLDHATAVAQVMHDFVNFNLPTHRGLQYLNDVGLLMFTKYALRVLKPIAETVTDKPFESAMSFALGHSLGASTIFDAIPIVSKNPLNVFADPISTFIGSQDDSIIMQGAELATGALFQ